MSLEREKVFQLSESRKKERKLPPGIIHDRKNNLLATNNFGKSENAVILVTGYPEGPNQLSLTEGVSLDTLFNHASDRVSFAQLYLGVFPNHITRKLTNALEMTRNSNTKLGLFSAGARSLQNLDYQEHLESVTFLSPFIGAESVGIKGCSKVLSLSKNLTTQQYLRDIQPLISTMLERDKQLEVILGENDPFINSLFVQQQFSQISPKISIAIQKRGHSPTPDELIQRLF